MTDRTCAWCRKRLRPIKSHTYHREPSGFGFAVRRVESGVRGFGYRAENLFCSLRCGYKWAVRELRAKGKGT